MNLQLATFNIKNVNANLIALQETLKECDVLAIQEHWLFNFEQKILSNVDPRFNYFARSVDDLQPISPYQKPRGYGGTAFMWRKSIDDMVKELPDGDKRVICIEISNQSEKLCLIGAYLPCRGNGANCETEYRETLDSIREIYTKYHDSHTVILMGDLNGSLTRDNPNSRDTSLRKFCAELNISTDVPKEDTFFHVNGKDSNQSDYILFQNSDRHLQLEYVTIGYNSMATNVSDHVPVKVRISSKFGVRKKVPEESKLKQRINWAKIDIQKYKSITDVSIVPDMDDNHDLSLAVDNVTNFLNKAAEECSLVPPKKPKKSVKGLNIWTPEIANLVKKSKEKHGVWTKAGEPPSMDHPTVIERKKAKCELRSAIRRSRAISRKRYYDEIMQAESEDQLLFYKLIRNQRSIKSTNTDTLTINGCTRVGDEQVLQGFANYFEDLATPKETCSVDYDEDYKMTAELKETILFDLYSNNNRCTTDHVAPIMPLNLSEMKKIVGSCKNGKAQDDTMLTAEHFKYAGDGVLSNLKTIINKMLLTKYIPPRLLHGMLTPILKKNKDKKNSSNYRGITVTSVIGKLLEKAWLLRANPIILSKQSKLQRGFTPKCSSTSAALMITESIAEAKDNKTPLYATFLNVTKAFDVVQHSILMNDIQQMGIEGGLWLMLQQL